MELDFIKKFIEERQKLADEQKAKLEEVDNKLLSNCKQYFLEHSKIRIGTHIHCIVKRRWDTRDNYYRVSRIEANTDGVISIYGVKRKINKEFGKREVYITCSSVYDTSISEDYEIVDVEC